MTAIGAFRQLQARRHSDRGQALVEFALVAPIFLLILFAIIQLGLLLGGQNSLVAAVRETARYAATYRVTSGGTGSDAEATCPLVLDKLEEVLHSNPLTADTATREVPTVQYTWEPEPGGSTYYVQVSVQGDYKFPLYVPLVAQFLDGMDGVTDNNLRLSAHEEMRIENDPLGYDDPDTPC